MKVSNLLFKKEAGKKILNVKTLSHLGLFFFSLIFVITILFQKDADDSYLKKSSRLINHKQEEKASDKESVTIEGKAVAIVGASSDESEEKATQKSFTAYKRNPNINYNAQQVISRQTQRTSKEALPTGANFVGKLLTSIDTRDDNQIIKVILPYGGNYKEKRLLPKNTIFLGSITYPGKGDKLFISFNSGVLPNGKEFTIRAQALNSKDYSSGMIGNYHSNSGAKVAGTLALSMVSGMTEVLTQKKVLNETTVTAESSLKNAMYHGISKVSELESSRLAGTLEESPPYLTVDAGSDLIISLISPLTGEDNNSDSLSIK